MLEKKSKREIINIIHESGAFERKFGWFLVNKIWHKPEIREKFYELLVNFWKQEVVNSNQDMLVCPEGLVSSFGIIPFASLLAHDMKYPMVIWKEYGDILTASSLMYPDKSFLEDGLRCIIFQDVISKGTTIQKMQNDLSQLKWRISKYVALIQIEKNQHELSNSFEDCRKKRNFLTDDFTFTSFLMDSDL